MRLPRLGWSDLCKFAIGNIASLEQYSRQNVSKVFPRDQQPIMECQGKLSAGLEVRRTNVSEPPEKHVVWTLASRANGVLTSRNIKDGATLHLKDGVSCQELGKSTPGVSFSTIALSGRTRRAEDSERPICPLLGEQYRDGCLIRRSDKMTSCSRSS